VDCGVAAALVSRTGSGQWLWSIFMLACTRSASSAQRQLPLRLRLRLQLLLNLPLTWVPVDGATSLVPKSDKEASAV
jgi:hypothetical protein